MLQQVCEYIHNYFIKASHESGYEIADGMISLPFLKDGQRFLIAGSDLNDGIYTYHSDTIMNDDDNQEAGLRDETFYGTVCALAVPPSVIALTEEIGAWVEKYGDAQTSPYKSENVIGVYSYEKASYGISNGTSLPVTWQDIYKSQLNRWRKVSF